MDYKDFVNDCMMDDNNKSAGRWTQEEHRLFLQGLQLYNKQWKLIADMVKTRTVVQVRTHAQKYFLKLEKGSTVGMSKSSDFQEQEYSGLRSDSISSVSSVGSALSAVDSDMLFVSVKSSNNMGNVGGSNTKSQMPRKRGREAEQSFPKNKRTASPSFSTSSSSLASPTSSITTTNSSTVSSSCSYPPHASFRHDDHEHDLLGLQLHEVEGDDFDLGHWLQRMEHMEGEHEYDWGIQRGGAVGCGGGAGNGEPAVCMSLLYADFDTWSHAVTGIGYGPF